MPLDNNDQEFNRHDVLMKSSLIIWYVDCVMTTHLRQKDKSTPKYNKMKAKGVRGEHSQVLT